MGDPNVLQVLRHARRILRKPGVWCRGGVLVRPHAGRCLFEAIREAARAPDRLSFDAWRQRSDIARITSWNDRPGRRLADVLDVLDRAMEREKRSAA